MTLTNKKNSLPKSLKIKNKNSIKFLVHGQGVFIFKYKKKDDELTFKIGNKDNTFELLININDNHINIKESNNQIDITDNKNNNQSNNQTDELLDKTNEVINQTNQLLNQTNQLFNQTNEVINQTNQLFNKKGIDNNKEYFWLSLDSQNEINYNKMLKDIDSKYFWLSLDSQNEKIQFGIGEPRIETQTFMSNFIDMKKKMEKLVNIYDLQNIEPIKLLRDPITNSVPLYVKNTDELTMNDIAQNLFIPYASLSPTSQILYNSIAGKKFILNDKDFPDFSKAIEYSIKTPGKWCYEKLQEKSREFNKDKPNILETYLRITLGQNNGESPGVPYVMEIWPVGHYSPIHNHAEAHAIIRVLNGTINVSLFAYLGADKPFGNANFIKDDITWISPTLNQIHQLKNLETNKETCITIQCYMYDNENQRHYDYFDYLDDNNEVQQYEPDSDMDFVKFKELMRMEWCQRKKYWCLK